MRHPAFKERMLKTDACIFGSTSLVHPTQNMGAWRNKMAAWEPPQPGGGDLLLCLLYKWLVDLHDFLIKSCLKLFRG